MINGNKVIDEVSPPKAEAILTQSIYEEDDCRKIHFYESSIQVEQNSKFKLYCAEINNPDEAMVAYKAVQRFKLATTATHLISAYKTSDNYIGLQDDGDFGMGRHLYNTIKDKGITNSIIFLAKDFGSVHMGQRRF